MNEKAKLYRKKPITITAEGPITEEQSIVTLEGIMVASPGDYIITGIKGERYPCKPDIFEASYDLVTDPQQIVDGVNFSGRQAEWEKDRVK